MAPVEVPYDSEVASCIATLTAESAKHHVGGANSSTLWRLVGQRRAVSFRHIKAHSGEAWNELVDAVCSAAVRHPYLRWGFRHPASSWTVLEPSAIRLLHLTSLPPEIPAAYPIGMCSGLMQQAPPNSQWIALKPSVIATEFDFAMQDDEIVEDKDTSYSQAGTARVWRLAPTTF